ncbi:glycosyltransferase [Frondihabitans australicus]|uniref:CDP-glycerol glycerophosphotransferase (TagB/SpsB family) n=1 Tax=Frondihabitans australicus TaxID=386892 RepID=A0A495IE61_9MICO|nr:glycosyltransferase [Frondihabitans australicus]RKR74272.1 CDP-glycerol glycerophosphotransferase (TagB/SpsB family) [Frondihabitans australicus]
MHRLAALIRFLLRALRFEVHATARRRPVRPDVVLYEAFAGSGALCNPEAIFREILRSPDLGHLRHVWVLDRTGNHRALRREFRRDRRVRFVTRDGFAYWWALATSGWLVNNATFPAQFSKRPGQVYLNTWHGTPLKAMGYDMPDGARESANTLRNFLQADYLLSQNEFMTESMYRRAYRLAGLYRGLVIEEGYPRVDRQRLDAAGLLRARGLLSARGLAVGRRRIVLFAPTWRGGAFNDPTDDIDRLVATVTGLQARLGDEYVVLLKTHQILERFVGSRPDLARILVPTTIPTNVVLGVADTLVTDFSSIFFDFLATGRRILFHAPDRDDYGATRGLAFGVDELPGPMCDTLDDLARGVTDPDGSPWLRGAVRDEWQARLTTQGGTDSSRRIVDVVFRGRLGTHRVRTLADGDRVSVLLHVGNLASNGITSSALNLLKALPADRFDVSIAYTRTRSRQQVSNAALVPPTVRQILRDGGMNGSKVHQLRRRLQARLGAVDVHLDDPRQRRLWDDEWTRVFGDARFDRVIDFSGYSVLWATLLLHSPEAPRAVWMHNDLVAELGRVVNGRRPLARSLPQIFGTLRHYDALAAVSPVLAQINERSLPKGALGGARILAVPNLVDAERVLRLGAARPFENETLDAPADGVENGDPDAAREPEPEWVEALQRHDGTRWFVTVGRYTREKNHERLLRAFARVHAEHPEARLAIIGHGPLRESLGELIRELGLTGAAHLTGPLSNPFSVMSRSACFVLSSDYEGQPMVLLEAALLGLPIVSTGFASVRDALPRPTIRVTPLDVDGLYTGMTAYFDGGVAPSTLDAEAYNRQALARFLSTNRLSVAAPREASTVAA